MDYEHWLYKAMDGIERTPYNALFLVKELFQGTEWNDLPKGDKLRFGAYFKTLVTEGKIPNINYVSKANNNSAQYRKIQEKEK